MSQSATPNDAALLMVNAMGFSLRHATIKTNRGTIIYWCVLYQPMA
jgi:hypothetical protein